MAGTVVIDHLICEGLKHCVVNHASHVTITNSLFLENYEAIHDDGASGNYLEVKRSIFFRNDREPASRIAADAAWKAVSFCRTTLPWPVGTPMCTQYVCSEWASHSLREATCGLAIT